MLARVNSDWDRPSEPVGNPMRGVGHAKRRVHFATAPMSPDPTADEDASSSDRVRPAISDWPDAGAETTGGSPASASPATRQSQQQQPRRLSSSVIDLIFDAMPVAGMEPNDSGAT